MTDASAAGKTETHEDDFGSPIPALVDVGATLYLDELGPYVPPEVRIRGYGSGEWEIFVYEWVTAIAEARQYVKVRQVTGSGDRGIDIYATLSSRGLRGPWHNFQCKHYDHALQPADAWPEIAKVIYHAWSKGYNLPEAYFFVAPRGVGPTLGELLDTQDELKKNFLDNFDKAICKLPLDAGGAAKLKTYARAKVDFSIFSSVTPAEIIKGHSLLKLQHRRRFGGPLGHPERKEPPPEVQETESRYLKHLLDAYREHFGARVLDLETASVLPETKDHYRRQRVDFYSAEAIRALARDQVDPGSFDHLLRLVHAYVVDVHEAEYSSGYERLRRVLIHVINGQFVSHPVYQRIEPGDLKGMCHHLANVDQLVWCKEARSDATAQ